jgi:hypothetical protein
MVAILKEYIGSLVEKILTESKQNIINLGYPPIVATLFFEKFGQKAFLLAKWYKEYKNFRNLENDSWWAKVDHGNIFRRHRDFRLPDMIFMYNAAISGDLERYQAARKEYGFSMDEEPDLEQAAKTWKFGIEEDFFGDIFFNSVFVKDISSGKIKDLKPYDKLTYQQAEDKYDKKRVFKDVEPIKEYPNGWRWINVGPKCQLVGGMMKNCGSTGVMSMDPDRTMITLFDPRNKAHVVVTYSPNDKRISGDQGVGSSAVKEIYHDYVFDLAKVLGVIFDFEKSNSDLMKIKGAAGPENVKTITSPTGSSYYKKVELMDGTSWYTNGYSYVSETDIQKMLPRYENDLAKTLAGVFHHDDRELRSVLNYVPSQKLAGFIRGKAS